MKEVAGATEEQAGSEAYQNEHMAAIFQEGLSFSGFERDKFFVNDGTGSFADLSGVSGIDDPNDGRAALTADFDDDGDVDLFVHNIARARHRLYRNDTLTADEEHDNRFVKVRLSGTIGARDAAGAEVTLRRPDGSVLTQVLSFGSGFVSQSAPELVFGLGAATGGDGLAVPSAGTLSVRWPGGEDEAFGAVPRGARVKLVEGTGTTEPVSPATFAFPDPSPPGLKLDVGASLGSLALADIDGRVQEVDLTSEGETWLNLWATWCTGCKAEMRDLAEIHARNGVRVVALSVDLPEQHQAAVDDLARREVGFDTWFLSDAVIEQVLDLDRLTLPTTLILDRHGVVREIIKGPVSP